jgi:PIN domain nuclease of toxin-antitoxin system
VILAVDAHALLWALHDHGELSDEARRALADPGNDVVVSAATIWEIEVKRAAGRLEAPSDLLETIEATHIGVLPITGADAVAAARLPLHHRDPFDRMLIAQALEIGAVIVSRDRAFAAYGVDQMLA